MLKRFIALACAAAMLAFAACGASEKQTGPDAQTGAPAADTADGTASQTGTEAQTTAAEPTDTSGPAGYGDASAGSARDMGMSVLHAAWAEDMQLEPDSFDEVSVADAPTAKVVFTVGAEVHNVQVLRLSLKQINEDGTPEFLTEAVYTQETLSPDRPLAVSMAFAGDIPNNGIAFTNADGYTYLLALDISGEDGSLLLTEF